jgi:hypothetical protein
MSNFQDTVVNWLLLRNNFVTPHVRPVLIGAINPFQKQYAQLLFIRSVMSATETIYEKNLAREKTDEFCGIFPLMSDLG